MANLSVSVLSSSGRKLGYKTYKQALGDVDAGLAVRESARCIRLVPICIVNHNVTESDYNADSCRAGRHGHITHDEVNELVGDGSIQPVEGARELAKDDDGREPDYVLEWLIPGRVLRYKREIPYRGSSAKLGWYLAEGLRKHRKWAQFAIADMRRHRKKNSKTKFLPGPRERMKVLEPGYGAQS